jgi:DNA-directed RNA polymerase subunit K/omega
MIELPKNFDSVFRYIVVVSQRAEQLINGAKPRTESKHVKRTLEARDDVDAGVVPWRVLSQEELDAQRQAIVDQFRAEVAGEGFSGADGEAIPDVLPTADGPEGEAPALGDEERDDELSRLQRLLGMVGTEAEALAQDDGEAEAAAEETEPVDAEKDKDGAGEKDES